MTGYVVELQAAQPNLTQTALRLLSRKLPGAADFYWTPPTAAVVFTSLGAAKRAGRVLDLMGWRVGRYIMLAEVDVLRKRFWLKVPAEGWETVAPEDILKDPAGHLHVVQRFA